MLTGSSCTKSYWEPAHNHPIILKSLLRGSRNTGTYSKLVNEVREEEALLEEKNQNSTTRPKQVLKNKKVLTCPNQVQEYLTEDDDKSGVELLKKTTFQVTSDLVMQDLMAQVMHFMMRG